MTCGAIEFTWPLASQTIADVAARLELDDLARLVLVGLRVGVEALAGLRAEPPLGDEAPQDRRRLEALAVLLLRALELLEHLVEAHRSRPS